MKTLLENYIKRSDEYIDICRGMTLVDYDKDAAKALDEAGKALRKSQNGDSWTMQDCKKGAELGREIAKILGGQFEFAEEVVKL